MVSETVAVIVMVTITGYQASIHETLRVSASLLLASH